MSDVIYFLLTLDLTENYCRNPNNAAKPWCYVDFGFKDCDVPQCDGKI